MINTQGYLNVNSVNLQSKQQKRAKISSNYSTNTSFKAGSKEKAASNALNEGEKGMRKVFEYLSEKIVGETKGYMPSEESRMKAAEMTTQRWLGTLPASTKEELNSAALEELVKEEGLHLSIDAPEEEILAALEEKRKNASMDLKLPEFIAKWLDRAMKKLGIEPDKNRR